MPERRTHDYYRHGITSLFAAFDIADDTVISQLHPVQADPGRAGAGPGPRAPDTLTSHTNLAIGYQEVGCFEDAQRLRSRSVT